jgi:hypothetical protein
VVIINESEVAILVESSLCETAHLSHGIVWVTIPILTSAIAYCGCAREQPNLVIIWLIWYIDEIFACLRVKNAKIIAVSWVKWRMSDM